MQRIGGDNPGYRDLVLFMFENQMLSVNELRAAFNLPELEGGDGNLAEYLQTLNKGPTP